MNYLKNLIDNELNNTDTDNICLISKEPLDDTQVSLPCSHQFNYVPLYNELICRKKNTSYRKRLLKTNELECPYCRVVSDKLIPFLKIDNVKKISGINCPKKYVYYPHKCEYCFKTGKKKGETCNKSCLHKYCDQHMKYNKNNKSLKNYTMIELKNICRDNKIKGFSKLKKLDLINLIKKNLDKYKNNI